MLRPTPIGSEKRVYFNSRLTDWTSVYPFEMPLNDFSLITELKCKNWNVCQLMVFPCVLHLRRKHHRHTRRFLLGERIVLCNLTDHNGYITALP